MSERDRATLTFDQIIDYSSVHEPADAKRKYGRAKLVRLVYDHAPSDAGRDNILKYFLTSLVPDSTGFPDVLTHLGDFGDWDLVKKESIVELVRDFADHLVDGFFIPCQSPFSRCKSRNI